MLVKWFPESHTGLSRALSRVVPSVFPASRDPSRCITDMPGTSVTSPKTAIEESNAMPTACLGPQHTAALGHHSWRPSRCAWPCCYCHRCSFKRSVPFHHRYTWDIPPQSIRGTKPCACDQLLWSPQPPPRSSRQPVPVLLLLLTGPSPEPRAAGPAPCLHQ